MFKETCVKCNGKGYITAYQNIVGGVCFSCAGKGYKIYKTSSKDRATAKAKRAEKIRIENAKGLEESKIAEEALFSKYSEDSRIGSESKVSCSKSEAYAYEVYSLLLKIDSGKLDQKTSERLLNNISK